MGLRMGNLFRGLAVRDQNKSIVEGKPIIRFKAFGRAARNLFKGHKKAPHEEPGCRDIDNAISLSHNETSVDNATNVDDCHNNVETVDIMRQTHFVERPSLEVGNQENISRGASTEPSNNGDLDEMLAELSADHHVEQSRSVLERDQDHLVNLLGSVYRRYKKSKVTLQATQEINDRLASELDESKERNKLVGRNLYRACQEAEYYREKMHHLNFVLEDEPGKYSDFDHEMELRDKRFSDLELRAAECSTEMARVEKDREDAYAEVAELNKILAEQDNNITWLIASKSEFQAKSEKVFDMLSDRIVPSDLFTAMNEYFDLVIRENDWLQQKVDDQALESSLDKDKARQLRIDNQDLEKQALANRETQAGLKDKIRTLDDEIGRLEFRIEAVIDEHRCEIKDKDSIIAVLRAEKDDLAQDVDSLARETDPSSIANMVARKNHKIAELKTEVKNLEDEKSSHEQNERHFHAVGEFNALANCYAEIESEELKIRVRNMDEELRMLRRRVYE